MTRNRTALAIVVLVAAVLFLGGWRFLAQQTTLLTENRRCDANAPGWMMEVQPDNAREGCIVILPSDQAPPDADWSVYCTMWCTRTWPEDAPDR